MTPSVGVRGGFAAGQPATPTMSMTKTRVSLAAIAGLFSKGEVRERLRGVETGEEIYQVLLYYEG